MTTRSNPLDRMLKDNRLNRFDVEAKRRMW